MATNRVASSSSALPQPTSSTRSLASPLSDLSSKVLPRLVEMSPALIAAVMAPLEALSACNAAPESCFPLSSEMIKHCVLSSVIGLVAKENFMPYSVDFAGCRCDGEAGP